MALPFFHFQTTFALAGSVPVKLTVAAPVASGSLQVRTFPSWAHVPARQRSRVQGVPSSLHGVASAATLVTHPVPTTHAAVRQSPGAGQVAAGGTHPVKSAAGSCGAQVSVVHPLLSSQSASVVQVVMARRQVAWLVIPVCRRPPPTASDTKS